MRNQAARILAMLASALLTASCSTLNPYHEDTMCPARNDFGKCVSMSEAYEKTLNEDDTSDSQKGNENAKGNGTAVTQTRGGKASEKEYREQLYREIGSLLKQPTTPILRPPKVRRVLVMPYKDGALFMPRYVYIMIDKPEWILRELPEAQVKEKPIELFSETAK